MHINELKDKLARLDARQDEILLRAGPSLTKAEQDEFDALQRDVDATLEELERVQRGEARAKTRTMKDNRADDRTGVAQADRLAPEERMADWAAENTDDPYPSAEYHEADPGKFLRGVALGDWKGAELERRVMVEGTGNLGGFTVPTPLSVQFIDLARAKMVTSRAGATTIPMTSQTLKYARLSGDVSSAWRSESDEITAGDGEFEVVTFTARSLAALVKVSRELVEDTSNAGEALTSGMTKSMAVEFDRVALRGSGTPPEPDGILNQTGVTSTSVAASQTPFIDYDLILKYGVGPVQDNNETPTAIVWHPRTGRYLNGATDADGQPLRAPSLVGDLSKFDTTSIPIDVTVGAHSDTSEIYVGDFTQLLLGMRTNLVLAPLNERYAEFGQVGFLAWFRGDVQLARPKAFAALTGVRGG